jgi:hypothetical protein
MKRLNFAFAAMFVFAHVAAATAPVQIRCPDEYPREKITVPVPAGWEGRTFVNRLPLAESGLLLGSPDAELPFVAEWKEVKTREGYDAVYTKFPKEPQLKEKWLFCGYGMGGDIWLMYQLPDNIKRCVVHHIKESVHGVYKYVECN